MTVRTASHIGSARLWLAFAALPVVNAIVGFCAFPLVWRLGNHGAFRPMDSSQAAAGFALLAGALGLVVTLFGALPVVMRLVRRGDVSLRSLAAAGLLLGNVPFALYVALILPFAIVRLIDGTLSEHLLPASELVAGTLRALLIGSVFGVISAVVFWLLAFRGRGQVV